MVRQDQAISCTWYHAVAVTGRVCHFVLAVPPYLTHSCYPEIVLATSVVMHMVFPTGSASGKAGLRQASWTNYLSMPQFPHLINTYNKSACLMGLNSKQINICNALSKVPGTLCFTHVLVLLWFILGAMMSRQRILRRVLWSERHLNKFPLVPMWEID